MKYRQQAAYGGCSLLSFDFKKNNTHFVHHQFMNVA